MAAAPAIMTQEAGMQQHALGAHVQSGIIKTPTSACAYTAQHMPAGSYWCCSRWAASHGTIGPCYLLRCLGQLHSNNASIPRHIKECQPDPAALAGTVVGDPDADVLGGVALNLEGGSGGKGANPSAKHVAYKDTATSRDRTDAGLSVHTKGTEAGIDSEAGKEDPAARYEEELHTN